MPEIRGYASSHDEWIQWADRLSGKSKIINAIIEDVTTNGLIEPFSNIYRRATDVQVDRSNLRETVSCEGLNSRKRALLAQIYFELRARGLLNNRGIKILSADGLSRVALVLRGVFPKFLGCEYASSSEEQDDLFPIPHMDLRSINYADNQFDIFVSGDVLQHVPDLETALAEIVRILKPGGVIVSSFPFLPSRTSTVLKAKRDSDGNTQLIAPPEYHGDPVRPDQGTLVFQLPGWDILQSLSRLGCTAKFGMIASSKWGVVTNQDVCAFTMIATKTEEKGNLFMINAQRRDIARLPTKVCFLAALPRSGTTLLTSMFSVHSMFETSYEPWNGARLPMTGDVTLDQVVAAEGLRPLGQKTLFVKETTAKLEYLSRLRALYRACDLPTERRTLVILRHPAHTMLSEIDRRNEWWGGNIVENAATFKDWCVKSRKALSELLDFVITTDGVILTLESISQKPAETIKALSEYIGFIIEPQQLLYQDHLDTRKVRGDRNIEQSPQMISSDIPFSRQGRVQLAEEMIGTTEFKDWYDAFVEIVEKSTASDLLRARDIPAVLRSRLTVIQSPLLDGDKK